MSKENKFREPHVITFSRLGIPEWGYISVAEESKLDFEVKRVFWTYFTPENIVRGHHAHHKTEQILIAVCGKIIVTTETANGIKKEFALEQPNQGVYIPPDVWHTMQYSSDAVQVVLTNTEYDEKDYIRDFDQFKEVWKK